MTIVDPVKHREFKFDDPEVAFKQARRRITNNALRRKQKSLDLAGFGLTSLPPEIGQLSELRELDIRNNRLTSLPPEIGQLTQLRSLILIMNEIESLPHELYRLTALTHVDLEQNLLIELPGEIGRLRNLQFLDLSSNKLSSLSSGIGGLVNLRTLALTDNQLLEIRPEIAKLINLRELLLDENAISNLPKEIGDLPQLNNLSITNNQLRAIPETIGNLKKLQTLGLNGNRIETLPDSIAGLRSLTDLDVSNNVLSELPLNLGKLTSLENLDASNNRLSSLPVELSGLSNLDTLLLQNNEITHLPISIGSLSNLTFLNLERNKLSELPIEIGDLTSLSQLQLNGNSIRRVPAELSKLGSLSRLALEDNQLEGLPKELGQLRSLERYSTQSGTRFPSIRRRSKLGLFIGNNPLPDPYPVLLAFGQPIATLNVLAWLREELDPSSLSLASPVPVTEQSEVAPPEPSLELGPSFQVVGGRLDLVSAKEDRPPSDAQMQDILHRRLRQQIELLRQENIKVGNQHPSLVQTVDEYEKLLSSSIEEIDVTSLWVVGNGLISQALSFERHDAKRTISEPLEPAHLALLTDVSRIHGGFILGFPTGVQLTERADSARIAPDVSEQIIKPTSKVLSALSRQRKLVSDRVRELADVLDAALITTGWQTARIGYSSYVTVRNFLIEVGKSLVIANEKASTPAGGILVTLAATSSGITPETFILMVDFLKTNAGDILSFVAPFPELRSWIAWIIDHFDDVNSDSRPSRD